MFSFFLVYHFIFWWSKSSGKYLRKDTIAVSPVRVNLKHSFYSLVFFNFLFPNLVITFFIKLYPKLHPIFKSSRNTYEADTIVLILLLGNQGSETLWAGPQSPSQYVEEAWNFCSKVGAHHHCPMYSLALITKSQEVRTNGLCI